MSLGRVARPLRTTGEAFRSARVKLELLEDGFDPELVLFVDVRDVWLPGLLELSVR